MPSSAFKDMWGSLKSKKPWNGVVKNLKKDGGFYYVNAHVVPILNENDEVEEYIAIRHDITELESYKRNLEDKLTQSTKEIVNTQKEIIQTMGQVAEKRSMETGAHVKRVATYSYMLARLIGLNEDEAKLLEQASPMHDIGKVAIPDQILNKKGPLTEDERKEMQTHTAVGYELLKHSKRELLQTAAIVAHEHHEFWNGLGYPRKLKGEEIHIYGRITAIADVYDALGHDRVYKKAWPIEKIISYFQDELGEQFDPKLTEIFLKNIDYFEVTRKNFEK
jgi:response regulator RpfG family c-di-GMP phosphodiesterase